MKNVYLETPIKNIPTRWGIATTAEELYSMQREYVDHWLHDEWLITESGMVSAMTHTFEGLVVVCMPLSTSQSILVHEAVHVFQHMMHEMGEVNPGQETQAYCIQFIFEEMSRELSKRRQKFLSKVKL